MSGVGPAFGEGDGRCGYPAFREAVRRFEVFLENEGWPSRIAWLQPEAVTTHRTALVVHPHRLLGDGHVEVRYLEAEARRLGVLLSALGHDLERSYCHLWAPEDVKAMELRRVPDGIKLEIAAPARRVNLRTGLRFAWRRWLGPPGEILEGLFS